MKYTDPYSTSRSRKVKNTLTLLVLFAMTATVSCSLLFLLTLHAG